MAEMATSSMVGKAMESLVDVAKTQIGYIRNSVKYVEKLKNESDNLKLMRGRVQQHINIAKRKGDDLLHGVQDWVNKADAEISKSEEFIVQDTNAKKAKFGFLIGDWSTRYQYSKRATTLTPSLVAHQERGKDFVTCVSVETPPPGFLDVYQNKDLEGIHTHNLALNDIIAALEDESNQIIGIHGLGGVGKTTLAKEVAVKVKHLFANVAFTKVSQTVNAEKIQKELENATKRIVKGEKVLIILDDVWEKLDLEDLRISINHTKCKILLTSRSEKVCQKMNAQRKICVNSLPIDEAWILLKRVVGEIVELDANLKLVASRVVEECGGLPLLIKAVANALKDESIQSWKWARTQLQKHEPLDIDDKIRKAFTHLKLSYEYLKSEEAKSCFLLCSVFPEDFDISLEDLVHYGVGLKRFDDLDSIEDARGRVQNAVNILTSSGLLLNSKHKGYTKMHDVVRDVALLIASKGENKFLVKTRQSFIEWLPLKYDIESYKGIALMYNGINKLPDYEVHLPHLELFILGGNHALSMISDEFIQCIKNVKVLDISWNNISSLPQSFQLLTKLRTLDLGGNKSLHEISILGELRELEILILSETGIIEIPEEIAQLVNLRVLEVKDCVDLSRITQGVISALSRLEELCIEFKLKFKGTSDCIVEVMSLSKLTYLDLTFPSIDDIPAQGQGFTSKNLKGSVIQIGEYNRYTSTISSISCSGYYLVLSKVHLGNSLVKRLKKLIEGICPITILSGIENLNNIMPDVYHGGFNKLEHIELDHCFNVSCLVDNGTRCNEKEGKIEEKVFKELKTLRLRDLYNLEMIWKCPDEYVSLTNLVTLYINRCDKLERAFTGSLARGLVNLKDLFIGSCEDLEEVIWDGDCRDDDFENVIVFPSLAQISLWNLWRLKSFYSGRSENYRVKYPSLVDVTIQFCPSMKIWGPGIHETPILKSSPRLLDGPNAITEAEKV